MSLEAVQSASANIEAIEVSCPESPYRKCSSKVFLNGVQVFGVIVVEAVVFLALIALVYRRQEI